MFIEVAIVTVLMVTKKKKKKLYISSQQGKEIDANLELKNKPFNSFYHIWSLTWKKEHH